MLNNTKYVSCIGINDEFAGNRLLESYCARVPFLKLVATYSDPLLAMPLLMSGEIDLIFLDFYMGTIDAPAFLQFVPNHTKVIIISSELQSKIKACGMAVTGIISVPYSYERFLSSVKSLLNEEDVIY